MTQPDVVARAHLVARSERIEAPGDLVDLASPAGFTWLAGDDGFVASGVAAHVAPADAVAFLQSISHDADLDVPAGAGPRAVAALPFHGPGLLTVPARIIARDAHGVAWRTEIAAPEATPALRAAAAPPTRFVVEAQTDRATWCAMVEHALDLIARDTLEKVVLARSVTIDADAAFDIPAVLGHLRALQPGCIVYGDAGFVGASPELLVRVHGDAVTSRPLAGTGTGPEQLMHSRKDGREHQYVVDAVVRALAACCTDLQVDGPAPLQLANVAHLVTNVRGRRDNPALSVLDLVAALHPTPAVAGTPTPAALDAISRLEPQPRGHYAGPCGWVDARGDGEFVVALRGGAIDGNRAVLHAGAGIVAGSKPDAEWAETQAKLTPMLQALVRP